MSIPEAEDKDYENILILLVWRLPQKKWLLDVITEHYGQNISVQKKVFLDFKVKKFHLGFLFDVLLLISIRKRINFSNE